MAWDLTELTWITAPVSRSLGVDLVLQTLLIFHKNSVHSRWRICLLGGDQVWICNQSWIYKTLTNEFVFILVCQSVAALVWNISPYTVEVLHSKFGGTGSLHWQHLICIDDPLWVWAQCKPPCASELTCVLTSSWNANSAYEPWQPTLAWPTSINPETTCPFWTTFWFLANHVHLILELSVPGTTEIGHVGQKCL